MSDFVVLDSSAILAAINIEPGASRVAELLPRSRLGSVNLAEVVTKLVEGGMSDPEVDELLHGLDLNVIAFDTVQATIAGKLRAATRSAGLSLGDRACLALALQLGATAVTADRAWSKVDVGVTIELLR